ncbi:MAG: transcription elongation factor GreA [Candidatus Omnitrophica bacterium]|nr:transcription elongation factor GreA [Candidatus Omnitrophota bacterium]
MSDKISLTREGYEKMQARLKFVKGPKRREIANTLDHARSLGDLSENAEYHAAREMQAFNEKEIAELENILSKAVIIDDTNIKKDEAYLGATITLKDLKTGEVFDYMLVSEEESDFDENKISVTSPVGKAMLGHKVGDVIRIQAPVCVLEYEIQKITR